MRILKDHSLLRKKYERKVRQLKMRILAIADEESRSLWDHYSPEKLEGIDLIISCGDLKKDYLEFLATMVKCPILYVPGNHDESFVESPPGGCECIDGKVYTFRGLRFFGLGGSMRYKPGPFMYTEPEMRCRILRALPRLIMSRGMDVFVSHAPAKGFGDLDDLPHRGFECFNKLIKKYCPAYMIHGHVHATYGKFRRVMKRDDGTTVINAYERYIFEIDEKVARATRDTV